MTKRAADVRSVTVSTDDRGSGYIATDVGGWFGSEQQFGLRANVAHEDIHSYVEHANGQRDFGLRGIRLEHQPRRTFATGCGISEQGAALGTAINCSAAASCRTTLRRKLLAHQSGSSCRRHSLEHQRQNLRVPLHDNWKGNPSASRSKVVIDDYSSFAWGGCTRSAVSHRMSATTTPRAVTTSTTFAALTIPGVIDELQAALSGHFDTGTIGHELTVGVSAFRRVVNNREAINHWFGSGNIDSEPDNLERYNGALNDSHRRLDSRQYGVFFNDLISFNEHSADPDQVGAKCVWTKRPSTIRYTTRHTATRISARGRADL